MNPELAGRVADVLRLPSHVSGSQRQDGAEAFEGRCWRKDGVLATLPNLSCDEARSVVGIVLITVVGINPFDRDGSLAHFGQGFSVRPFLPHLLVLEVFELESTRLVNKALVEGLAGDGVNVVALSASSPSRTSPVTAS